MTRSKHAGSVSPTSCVIGRPFDNGPPQQKHSLKPLNLLRRPGRISLLILSFSVAVASKQRILLPSTASSPTLVMLEIVKPVVYLPGEGGQGILDLCNELVGGRAVTQLEREHFMEVYNLRVPGELRHGCRNHKRKHVDEEVGSLARNVVGAS